MLMNDGNPVRITTKQKYRIFAFIVIVTVLLWLFSSFGSPSDPPMINLDQRLEQQRRDKSKMRSWSGEERKSGLTLKDNKFFLNGRDFFILSGAIHYFRVHPEYWEDRLKKLRSAGLNTVETYVAWNLHETKQGQFDFKTGFRDIRRFIEIAFNIGLYVIIRPGPYICAEWDLGGLPAWLLSEPDMKLRSTNTRFLEASESYFARLLSEIQDMQYMHGGPIIAFQVENEYGSYGDDVKYVAAIRDMMLKYGASELLFMSNGGSGEILDRGRIPGLLMTANFQEKKEAETAMANLKKLQPTFPIMVTEFWSGWFDHWGEPHHTVSKEKYADTLRFLLKHYRGINLFMFHGGTSFGFFNGANQEGSRYEPTVTSYDYDAPLSEMGSVTDKLLVTRQLIEELVPEQLRYYPLGPPGPIPDSALLKTMRYGPFKVSQWLSLDEALKFVARVEIERPAPMEQIEFLQGALGHGFILYRKTLNNVTVGKHRLRFDGTVADRAIVKLNEDVVGIIDYSKLTKNSSSHQPNDKGEIPPIVLDISKPNAVLSILVENMGRVNFQWRVGVPPNTPFVLDQQHKGITGDVFLDARKLSDWTAYPLPLDENFLDNIIHPAWKPFQPSADHHRVSRPAFYMTDFEIQGTPRDTFLSLPDSGDWSKGVAFLNNFNLGRYWTQWPGTLYVPAPLFREGPNNLVLFDLHSNGDSVVFLDHPVYP